MTTLRTSWTTMAGRTQLLRQKQQGEAFSLPLNLWNPNEPKYLPTQAAFVGDWDVRFRGFGGGLGNGKCIKIGTRVSTVSGEQVIEQIEPGTEVWTIDENLKLCASRVRARIDSGLLPETILRLDNGLSLSCSPWHPFLKMRGTMRQRNGEKPTKHPDGTRADRRDRVSTGHDWTRADGLSPGQRIAVAIEFPEGRSCGKSLDHLFLLGVILGDGGLTQHKAIGVTLAEPALIEEIDRILADDSLYLWRGTAKYCYRISARTNTGRPGRNWMVNWIESLGLTGASSHTKFIPSIFLGATKVEIAALLSGLFVTDGWVDRNYVGYCSVSESLLDGVQSLLLRLGIRAQKCKRFVKYKGTLRPAFYLQIADCASIRRCAEWLDLRYKQPKLLTLLEKNLAKVPRGRTRRFVCGQVEFVRISSITQAPDLVQMYDLDIEGTHNFIGNGIVAHNTNAGVALAFHLSTCFPGNCGYIGRWDGKELIQTTMAEFFRLIPESMFAAQNKQLGYLKFKGQYGGSEIFYGDLKKEEWASSLNLGWFWFDQAEETDEKRWNHGVSRLRRMMPILDEQGQPVIGPWGKALMAPTYGFATFNPEGTGSYLWRFFHPDSPTKQPGYRLYQATTYDGLAAGFVTQQYVDDMLAVFPEQARKRYLEGSWDVFEGKVFTAFDPALHCIPPVTLQPSWDYYVSMDHGLTNQTSVGVWAVTPDGVKIRIREHYEGGGRPVSYHAACTKNLVQDLPKRPVFFVMDPACWANNQSKDNRVYSIVDEYNEHGVFPVPGQHDVKRGLNRINEALAVDPAARHPITGEMGSPRLLAVDTCYAWTREMQNYKWKKARGAVLRNAPDEPQDYQDHAIDETRYLFSLLPTVQIQTVQVAPTDALAIWAAQRGRYNPLATHETSGPSSWMSV